MQTLNQSSVHDQNEWDLQSQLFFHWSRHGSVRCIVQSEESSRFGCVKHDARINRGRGSDRFHAHGWGE